MDWSSCGNSQPASKLGIESVVMVVESLLEGNLANAIWMQHLWTMLSCSAHVTGPKGRSRWNVFGMQHDPATTGWQIRGALPCSRCASGGMTLALIDMRFGGWSDKNGP